VLHVKVTCPCCQTAFVALVQETVVAPGERHNAELQRRMDAEFARWYLWSKLMAELHPENPDTALLVALFRRVDDLEQRHRADPEGTASNLADEVGESAIRVLQRVLDTYPEASRPV
jgi:hypothetical protein